METATKRWLAVLAEKYKTDDGPATDYRVAKLLGILPSSMSNYLGGRGSQMDDDIAARLADLVGEHPLVVIGQIRAERSRTERAKKVWVQAAGWGKKHGRAAAVILSAAVSALSPVSPMNNLKNADGNGASSVYYVI